MESGEITITADASGAIQSLNELQREIKKTSTAFEKVKLNKWKFATFALSGFIVGLGMGIIL